MVSQRSYKKREMFAKDEQDLIFWRRELGRRQTDI
jgi:hypothetical protein